MRSSISASSARRAAWQLLAGCIVIALVVEAAARAGFDRVSKIQLRTTNEYWLARTIGHDATPRGTVLIVGNSLLDEDVNFERLSDALAAQWQTRRFVIENTGYYDWYYGLRRLFREGARPDVVVLMLSSRQWMRTDIRGDYSAYYLMSTGDLALAATDLGLNGTQAISLGLANFSKFWAARAEIRNFVLARLMPDLERLMHFSNTPDPHPLIDDEVEATSSGRVQRLKALAEANGVQLLLLLPPVIEAGKADSAVGMLRSARKAGVPTLRPIPSGELGLALYRDAGHHLNPRGATIFTERLIPVLRAQLVELAAHSARASRH